MDLQGICVVIESVAQHTPVALDHFTMGLHPDATKREDGQLALLDWTRAGDVRAEGWAAAISLIDHAGQVRALGAALLAILKRGEALRDDLPVLHGLAELAESHADKTPGGPPDPALRIGLCAQAIALSLLGGEGDIDPHRGRGMPRDEARLHPDPNEFWRYDVIAHMPVEAAL